MKSEDKSFNVIHQMVNFLQEYFEKQGQRLNRITKNSLSEFGIFQNFVSTLSEIGTQYEQAIFRLCQKFQNEMTEEVKDEKLCQFYQLVVNNLLRHHDSIQQKYDKISTLKSMLASTSNEFAKSMDSYIKTLDINLMSLKDKCTKYDSQYKAYILKNAQAVIETPKLIIGQKSGINSILSNSQIADGFNIREEESLLKKFQDIEITLQFNVQQVNRIFTESSQNEIKLKTKTSKIALSIIQAFSSTSKDQLELKINAINNHFETFRSNFETTLKETAPNFNSRIDHSSIEIRFFNYFQFVRIESALSQFQNRFYYSKLMQIEENISAKFRIYIELLINFLYRKNIEFSREIIDDLNGIMLSPSLKEYFIYSLILRKNIVLNDRQFAHVYFKKEQQRNLMTIAQYFFSSFIAQSNTNHELIFHFLKFSMLIVNDLKDPIIENFSKIAIFHEVYFWKELMSVVIQMNFQIEGIEVNFHNVLMNQNLFNSIKINTEGQKNNIRDQCEIRAFEDVSLLLFRLRLDFEKIADVLMELGPLAGISFESIKLLLLRNQELFLNQICEHNFLKQDKKTNPRRSLVFKQPKIRKLTFILKHLVFFLADVKSLVSLFGCCQMIYKNRCQITKKLLASEIVGRDQALRRYLYIMYSFQEKAKVNDYTSDIGKDLEPIIILDVKRTIIHSESFKADELTRVLYNLTRKEGGNFQYYQGLNYVVNYLLVLFNGNEKQAYQIMIYLLNTSFKEYLDHELRNLKLIFFYVKRILRRFLPTLSNYFESDLKLDIDIICASWCITLFTISIQYDKRSEVLDEIFDIFLAKGWVGFCRVLLVIFDQLQSRLLKCNYEEAVILLSDLSKTCFRDLVTPGNNHNNKPVSKKMVKLENRTSMENVIFPINQTNIEAVSPCFSFKSKIEKFKELDDKMLSEFSEEYQLIMEKMEDFWSKLSRKIKLKNEKKEKL